MSVDLPMPDWPISALRCCASHGRSADGSRKADTSTIG